MTEFNLDIFKMGHFILYRHDKGFVGDRIVKAQLDHGFSREQAQYTHVDVSMGGPYAVRINPPKGSIVDITKQYPGRHIRVYSYRADDYDVMRYKVGGWAASHCNIKYDAFGVLRFRLPFLPNPDWLYFCSENSLWSLQRAYCGALGIHPRDCMPAHISIPECFKLDWEGDIPEGYTYEEKDCCGVAQGPCASGKKSPAGNKLKLVIGGI